MKEMSRGVGIFIILSMNKAGLKGNNLFGKGQSTYLGRESEER